MRRLLGCSLSLGVAAACLASATASAQPRGGWHVPGGEAAHDNWQKSESKISTETFAGSFRFLWKFKPANASAQSGSFSEPLATPSIISSRGFKDMVLWGDSNSLYAVDYVQGTVLWRKDFHLKAEHAPGTCQDTDVQIVMEPPHVIHFGARRSHTSSEAPPPPPPTADRWIGAPAAGGGFSLKGIYALTSDGYLHEQILASGLDYAPAVAFLPHGAENASGLNMNGKLVYTESGRGCRHAPNAVWSIDLNTSQHPIHSYQSQRVTPADLTGPTIGSDGTVYISTGGGKADPSAGVHSNSLVALTAGALKVKDWYTPQAGTRSHKLDVSPIVLSDNDKDLIAGPGGNGSIVLLDSGSLGGSNHGTPLAQTAEISNAKKPGWESLASWQDNNGTLWLLASISGPVRQDIQFANTNGAAPHGSIVAFKVDTTGGHTALTPAWISGDLMNPAPPVIVNGVVFALAGGDASHHAILYALDAATGKQLYSSKDAVTTYTHLSGVSVADGHVFFTTHDHTLYAFGIPMEH